MTSDTKELILDCAIDLFAVKGYEAVSVRDIASEVGIKASSLYKHYENKEAILETIFEQFRDLMQATHQYEVDMLTLPQNMSAVDILKVSFFAFKDLVYQPRLLKITRIINLEQGRNPQVRSFFLQEMIDNPIKDLETTFTAMIRAGLLKAVNPAMLAKTYHANIIASYYIHNLLKPEVDIQQVVSEMVTFIEFFCHTYAVSQVADSNK